MAEATFSRDGNDMRMVPQSAIAAGEIIHLRDGRAGYLDAATSVTSGSDAARFKPSGIVTVPKTAGIAVLDGGDVWWNFSNSAAHFRRGLNSKDFFLGSAVGDAASADVLMAVNLNVRALRDFDLARDPWTTAPVGTQALGGFLPPQRRGGAHGLVLSSTSEAQKSDCLGNYSFAAGAKAIVEIKVTVVTTGSGGAQDLSLGVASATHATDASSIAQRLFLHLDGNATKINFESADGTTTVAITDSLSTYTAGTQFEAWLDMRNPLSVALYVEGVRVLSGTTFNVNAAASAWKLLAHLEKTAAVDVYEVSVDELTARVADQSTNAA